MEGVRGGVGVADCLEDLSLSWEDAAFGGCGKWLLSVGTLNCLADPLG